MLFITPEDLVPFATLDPIKAAEMVRDAEALAVASAPGLSGELTLEQRAAVKAILRGAILRWEESGTGAFQAQSAGPFSVQTDTRQSRRGMFYPSEIDQLRAITAVAGGRAFSFVPAPAVPVAPPLLGWYPVDGERWL